MKKYKLMKRFDALISMGDEYKKSGNNSQAGICYDKAAELWERIIRSGDPLTPAETHLFMQEYCLN